MLTQILRDRPEIAQRLYDLALPYVEPMEPPKMLAPPQTRNYAQVGTAFDYMIRWEIQRRNHAAEDRVWVAELALKMSNEALGGPMPEPIRALYSAVVKEARDVHGDWLCHEEGKPGSILEGRFMRDPNDPFLIRVAKTCLCLARIDPLYRSRTIDPEVNRFDQKDVVDLVQMFRIAPWATLAGDETHIPLLNPEFGSLSKRFMGADADLIVGNLLIDFKASKYFGIEKHLPQLVGYGMISDLYRDGEAPLFPLLHRAGIYFARHGVIQTFDYDAVRSAPNYITVRDFLLKTADEEVSRKIEGVRNAVSAASLL